MLERAAGSDVLWADALLSQACSLWYMILPAHLRSQWNKGEVLSQALDLLDTLSSSHALPNDEVAVIYFTLLCVSSIHIRVCSLRVACLSYRMCQMHGEVQGDWLVHHF